MRREARSGRRVDDAGAARVRVINKVAGLRLWNAHLRVSRSAGQPVVEIHQRPWTSLVVPAFYAALGLAVVFGQDEPAARGIALFILTFVVVMAVGIYIPGRAWARAGPDGLTIRRAMQRAPQTFPWSDIDEVHVITEARYREYVTMLAVIGSEPNRMLKPMRLLRPLSVRRSHLLALVLLATCHRYGARGLYLGETEGWGWRGGWWRRRPLARDERYLRPRASRSALDDRSDQRHRPPSTPAPRWPP